jgi:hypothetical protein
MSCPICREPLLASQPIALIKHKVDVDIAQSRKRAHYFHHACITEWSKQERTCPLDRDTIRTIYKVQYYETVPLSEINQFGEIINNLKITDKMLQSIDDINQPDKTGRPLAYYACKKGNYALVAMLLKHGADFHFGTFTPLMVAVANNHSRIVKYLLKNPQVRQSVNKSDTRGKTAFDYACENHCLSIIKEMLARNLVTTRQVSLNITNNVVGLNKDVLFGEEILKILYDHLK